MSEYMFGVTCQEFKGVKLAKIRKIAKKHGAEFVSYKSPGNSVRGWFVTNNKGEPFNSRVAQSVKTELQFFNIDL